MYENAYTNVCTMVCMMRNLYVYVFKKRVLNRFAQYIIYYDKIKKYKRTYYYEKLAKLIIENTSNQRRRIYTIHICIPCIKFIKKISNGFTTDKFNTYCVTCDRCN